MSAKEQPRAGPFDFELPDFEINLADFELPDFELPDFETVPAGGLTKSRNTRQNQGKTERRELKK